MKDDKVLNEIIHKVITRIEEDEQLKGRAILEEGFMDSLKKRWEGVKHGVSKLGRTQKGGKFVGKDKVDKTANRQLQNARTKINKELRLSAELQKEANVVSKDILKVFVRDFKKQYPGFPNMKDKEQFKKAVDDANGTIYVFYDTIKKAAGLKPEDPKYIAPVLANSIIKYLRMWVEKLIDYDLAQVYQYMENKEDVGTIIEAEPIDPQTGTVLSKKGPLTGTEDTHTKKVLKSQWLPILLGLAGGAGIGKGLSWFFNSSGIKGIIDNVETTEELGKQVSVKLGNGITQTMQEITGGNYSTVGDLRKHLATIGGGKWQRGIEQLGGIMAPADKVGMTVVQQQEVLEAMLNNSTDNEPISKIFGQNSGFFKSTAEKVLNKTINTTNAYGNMTGMPFGVQLKGVLTAIKLAKTAALTGAAGTVGILANPLAIIGTGALMAGALLGYLRYKGTKQSRFQKLDKLLASLKYFEEGKAGDPVSADGANAVATSDTQFQKEAEQVVKTGESVYATVGAGGEQETQEEQPNKTDNVEVNKGSAIYNETEIVLYNMLKNFFIKIVEYKKYQNMKPSQEVGQEETSTSNKSTTEGFVRGIVSNIIIEVADTMPDAIDNNLSQKLIDTYSIQKEYIAAYYDLLKIISDIVVYISGNNDKFENKYVQTMSSEVVKTASKISGFRQFYTVTDAQNESEIAQIAFIISNFFNKIYDEKLPNAGNTLPAIIEKFRLNESVRGIVTEEDTVDFDKKAKDGLKYLPVILQHFVYLYKTMKAKMANKNAKQKPVSPNKPKTAKKSVNPQNLNNKKNANQQQDEEI